MNRLSSGCAVTSGSPSEISLRQDKPQRARRSANAIRTEPKVRQTSDSASQAAPCFVDPGDNVLCQYLIQVGKGDQVAFEQVYKLSAPTLFGIALKLMPEREQAEDVLQEAYVQIWRHADRFAPAQGAAMAWLVGIVRFRAIDRLRKERKLSERYYALDAIDEAGSDERRAIEQDPLVVDASDAEEMAGAKHKAIYDCLNKLDSKVRACILLALHEGYTHQELSAYIGAPLGSVKSWLRRGMVALRQCLQSKGLEAV